MLNDKDREYVLNSLLKLIDNISDKDYQRKVWIRGEGNEVNDFDETVCFVSDFWEIITETYKDFKMTREQYLLLENFKKI